MTVSNISVPVHTSQVAPALMPASTQQVASDSVRNEEISPSSLPRMQNLGLTNLRQTVMQGINDHLGPYLVPALYNLPTSEKVKGAAMVFGGATAKVLGKEIAKAGGMGSNAVGTAMIWGGGAKRWRKLARAPTKRRTRTTVPVTTMLLPQGIGPGSHVDLSLS